MANNRIQAGLSRIESFVYFQNSTNRDVNLYWIDYRGDRKLYLMLIPGAGTKVNTYRYHPWIFLDARTNERMHVAHQDTFFPEPYKMRDPNNTEKWIPCRRQFSIHYPLRTLRESCLWKVAETLNNVVPGKAKGAIESLRIPRTIKSDLGVLMWQTKHQL